MIDYAWSNEHLTRLERRQLFRSNKIKFMSTLFSYKLKNRLEFTYIICYVSYIERSTYVFYQFVLFYTIIFSNMNHLLYIIFSLLLIHTAVRVMTEEENGVCPLYSSRGYRKNRLWKQTVQTWNKAYTNQSIVYCTYINQNLPF